MSVHQSNITDLKPTEEQQEVIEAVSQPDSLMINARAGCSKTTSLQMAARRVKSPALALAFNKKIAKELEPRLPGNFAVKTLNGMGHSAWGRALPQVSRVELDDKKLGKLISQIAKERKLSLSSDQWSMARQLASRVMQMGITPGDIGEPLHQDTEENWADCAEALWIPRDEFDYVKDLAREVIERDISLANQGIISFDDQVYCSVCLGGKFPKYPVVFIDEAQDLSPLNHAMLSKCLARDGKIVAVGDEAQCHPPGIMVQLSRGKSKAIEDVVVGDEIVSYNRKVGFTGISEQGRLVTATNISQFKGDLIRIVTDGPFAVECTPNHKCMVRFHDKRSYCLYLMQKGDYFRIGIAQSWYRSEKSDGGFGPSMRARHENADALWVLDVYDSKDSALVSEKVVWTMFGLPDLIFHCSGKLSSTQAHLDSAWKQIGPNARRAKECLKHFRREFAYPIWTKENTKHIGEKTFVTEACNLISGSMAVKVFDGSQKGGTWLNFWVDYTPYEGPVYGITVQTNGFGLRLYVANGIVIHNSIYAFRGASGDSMVRIRKLRPKWIDAPLNTTFRCPKVIVERQQWHVPGFKAWPTNRQGRVMSLSSQVSLERTGWNWGDVAQQSEEALDSTAVLCRNNAPLLGLAFKLLRQQIGVVMLGRDIGKGLIVLSKKLLPEDSTLAASCAIVINEWAEHETGLARANGQEEKVDSIYDRADCLQAVLSGSQCRDAGQLRAMLEKLFSRDTGLVTLSTIHRAKGLEWNTVVHLDPWRVPSKQARKAAAAGDSTALRQENNLLYVCETRTKNVLINANLEDFES